MNFTQCDNSKNTNKSKNEIWKTQIVSLHSNNLDFSNQNALILENYSSEVMSYLNKIHSKCAKD